jgi:2-dehydropantoate 2-reductase
MTTEKKRITVVGAGGMGALFGAILADGGLDVALVDTDEDHIEAINRDGLKIKGFGGDRTRHICATTDAGRIEQADIVLVQCKAHGTRAAAEAAKHLIDGGATAISFQNGLGNEDILAEVLGETNVLGGLTTMAGCKLGPGVIQDFSRTSSWIGEMGGGLSDRAQAIAVTLSNAGLETKASGDVVRDIWKKLLGNIAMSAVSGINDLTSAEALAVPELKQTSIAALDEALAVANAAGIRLDRAAALDSMESISVPGGNGDNKSSLCVDLLNRRPTEVNVIYGSVIDKGQEFKVPTPTLNALASLVKWLESRYLQEGLT